MKWLKHAFAVDEDGPAKPTAEQHPIVEAVCEQIVKRHLTTPAIAFLEMSRPMNYLSAQALHFFAPIVSVLTDADGHRHFAAFLEKRGSIDYLCRRIEELEELSLQRDRTDSTDSDKSPQSSESDQGE